MITAATDATETHRRTTPTPLAVAGVLWILAAAGYLLLEYLTARGLPGYSYTRNYISSLGAYWSRRAYLMNGAFYLQGGLFVVGMALVAIAGRARWRGGWAVLLALPFGVGICLVGYVHGGSPLWNGGHEWLHQLGAILAFLFGNAATLAASATVARIGGAGWFRPVGRLLGVAGLVLFVMLQRYAGWVANHVAIGTLERACVYTILVWQVLAGLVLLRRRAHG